MQEKPSNCGVFKTKTSQTGKEYFMLSFTEENLKEAMNALSNGWTNFVIFKRGPEKIKKIEGGYITHDCRISLPQGQYKNVVASKKSDTDSFMELLGGK